MISINYKNIEQKPTDRFAVKQAFTQATSEELGVNLQHAKTGELNGRNMVVIADAGAVEAAPALKKKFRQTNDLDTKVTIASALVKLGDPDDVY